MKRTCSAILPACVLCGCIFGSGGQSLTNNATNNPTANNTAGTNNTIVAETYAEASVSEFPCTGESAVLWYAPEDAGYPALVETSTVAVASPPTQVKVFPFLTPYGVATVGSATANADGDIEIAMGVLGRGADDKTALVALDYGTQTITGGDVLDVYATPSYFLDLLGEGAEEQLATMVISTTTGPRQCSLWRVGPDNTPEVRCPNSSDQAEAFVDAVGTPRRIDFAPVFTAQSGKWWWLLQSADYLYTASAGTDAEEIAFLTVDPGGIYTELDLTTLVEAQGEPGEVFAERVIWGVETESNGWPGVAMLGREAGSAEYRPLVLSADNQFGDYIVTDVEWRLSSRVTPGRGTFTFVDGYRVGDIVLANDPLRYEFPYGNTDLGYVAIGDGGAQLIFSAPGRVGDDEFVYWEGDSFVEVAAFRNVPVKTEAEGDPLIAVVHGTDREKLAVINWSFERSIDVAPDVSLGEFTEIQQLPGAGLLGNDSGVLGFRAKRADQYVFAAYPVDNASSPYATCQR